MAVNDLITAARYNVIQSKAGNVLGNGTGQLGYGEALSSYQLGVGSVVNDADMVRLRSDLVKIHAHQTGTLPANLPTIPAGDDITDADYVLYETVADTVYTNKNQINVATQASVESKVSSQRTSVWGGGGQQKYIYEMKTHEATDGKNETVVEFCFHPQYWAMYDCYSTTYPDATPYQAWRAGFREGVKMCLDRGRRPDITEFEKSVASRNYDTWIS